jgi:hypothetical protein
VLVEEFSKWVRDGRIPWKLPAEFPLPDEQQAPETLQANNVVRSWPWGNYDEGLLQDLAAAVNEFWKDYDASVDDGKDRRKVAVIEFLKKRGISETAARAIDTTIRPKDWKSGPPKGQAFPRVKPSKKKI